MYTDASMRPGSGELTQVLIAHDHLHRLQAFPVRTDPNAYDAYASIFTSNTYHTCVNANTTIRLPHRSAFRIAMVAVHTFVLLLLNNITTALSIPLQ